MANDAERARWNDEGWAESWIHRERLTDAVSPVLLDVADPQPGQRVCDIGCGGGNLTVAVAERVGPRGEAVGMDVSGPLLELARRRVAGAPAVRFVLADLQTDAVPEEPFDLAVSQFGVMFFDEPEVAFAAIRRLLRPGGKLVFACWQGAEFNPWHTGVALSSEAPPPPALPPGKNPVGPFVFGDDLRVRGLLAAAGFATASGMPYRTVVRGPASAVVDRVQLGFMGIPPEKQDHALALVLGHLEQFAVGEGEYDFPLAFRVYDAVNIAE